MGSIVRQIVIRAACLLLALNIGLTVSRADVLQSTVVLPPPSGTYTLGSYCDTILTRCTQDAMVSGFGIVSHEVQNGDELVGVTATYSADIFTNIGGVPGAFLGHLILPGTAMFKFIGRDPAVNPLGIFTTELTDFDFLGMLNGNTFEIKKDPARTSTGLTTILPATLVPPITFSVRGNLQIAALYSFNGGDFVAAPPRTATVGVIPEPGSGALVGPILAGVIGTAFLRRRRHRKNRSKAAQEF